jgi:hypothetical protein
MQRIFLVGALIAVGGLLFAVAGRRATQLAGGLLLAGAGAIFAVRLHHAGPYPVPRGMDLAIAAASLLLGALLVLLGRARPAGAPATLPARALLALAPLVLLFAVAHTLHELGEVVVLRTTDERETVLETRLWVVDSGGFPWVVTGPETPHVRRLAANPRVELVRGGVATCFVAERHGDRETIEAVLRARHRKYLVQRLALALGFWRESYDLEKIAVAIRFLPCPP